MNRGPPPPTPVKGEKAINIDDDGHDNVDDDDDGDDVCGGDYDDDTL